MLDVRYRSRASLPALVIGLIVADGHDESGRAGRSRFAPALPWQTGSGRLY